MSEQQNQGGGASDGAPQSSSLHSYAEFRASLKDPRGAAPAAPPVANVSNSEPGNGAAQAGPTNGKAAAKQRVAEVAASATAESDAKTVEPEAGGGEPVVEGDGAEDLLEPERAPVDPAEAAAKYQAWLDGPDLPAEFHDKLVEVKVGKHTQSVKLSEALRGYGSKREATRMVNEGIAAKKEAARITATYDQHFAETKASTEAFIEVYERNGYDLVAVARAIAKREASRGKRVRAIGEHTIRELGGDVGNEGHWADPRVVQAMKDEESAIEAERARDIKLREREAEIRRLTEQQSVAAGEADSKAMQEAGLAAYAQLAPIAFKAFGLKDNGLNRGKHLQLVKELIAQEGYSYDPAANGGKPWRWAITRQHCLDAAQMLREEVLERQGSGGGVTQSRAVSGANAMGTGAGGVRAAASQEAKPLGSYRDFLDSVNGRGR